MIASRSHPSLSFFLALFALALLLLLRFSSFLLFVPKHRFTLVQNTAPNVRYAVPLTSKVAMYTSAAPK